MSSPSGKKKTKNLVWFLVKAVVSLSILWYLFSRTDITSVYRSLLSADLLWLSLAFFMLYIGKGITAYRWQGLLAAQDLKIPFRTLLGSIFVGQFFNSFLPTTVGGDVVRAYDTANQSNESIKSAMSVFTDRLIGVFALALLAFLALVSGYLGGVEVSFYVLPVLAVFAICSFGMLMIYFDGLVILVDRSLTRLRLNKLAVQLRKAYQSLRILKEKPKALIAALAFSILLQVNVVLFYYFIGLSLDLGVQLLYFWMIVPIALIVVLVPFSINGIGIREGIFVFLLTGLGVVPKDAIALSLISFGLILTQGLVGGVIFALRGINLPTSKEQGTVPQENNK